jgi:hypothetical protein
VRAADLGPRYRRARSLLITADAGGSNGPRVRLWKWQLQRLANRTHLAITVCHLPPGTSKWNKIEHRLFSYISTNWRGQPLVSLAVIVNLIGGTRTTTGLRVRCELDRGAYPKGQDVTDAQMAPSISPRTASMATGTTPFTRTAVEGDFLTCFLTRPKCRIRTC